jgi:hypothetical protein
MAEGSKTMEGQDALLSVSLVRDTIVVHRFCGEVRQTHVLRCMRYSYGCLPRRPVLWDLSRADLSKVFLDKCLQFLLKLEAKIPSNCRPDGRTALLFPKTGRCVLGPFLEGFAKHLQLPCRIQSFDREDDATAWLSLMEENR